MGAPSGRTLVRLFLCSGLLTLVALAACRDPAAAAGTALFVTTEFEPSLNVTRLRVSGTVADGTEVPTTLLPEDSSRALQSGETFRVLLDGAANGTQATVRVEGLRDGTTVIASGEATASVRDGYEVEVTVRLTSSRPTSDGGTGGGTDGGTNTFCLDCPDGCCREGFCTARTFLTCGVGGVACEACDGQRTDTCTARGTCGCGNGPACSGNTDRCNMGKCFCGPGNACGPGLACVNGACRCDPSTCNGCCEGNSCIPSPNKNQCGKGGAACKKCDKKCNPDGTCD
ncbi:hypothetical protein [Corallococcus aberystwythensis]|uniref:hypothetical protein n=1 Tax=Corallococcus aberystwythensis TaxID=2316722 RepID=UPI001FC95003|nr:hypothetical protein [Corallococcus aberystwythensis]